ncbi:MAG: hypothetical protein IPF38_12785 [Burkholderiales bacterium]|nr:hypothetical protein [Burkholderiales bacterium]
MTEGSRRSPVVLGTLLAGTALATIVAVVRSGHHKQPAVPATDRIHFSDAVEDLRALIALLALLSEATKDKTNHTERSSMRTRLSWLCRPSSRPAHP